VRGYYISITEDMTKNPQEVTKLNLSKNKLTAFPEEIFVFSNLTHLILNKNKIEILPSKISTLNKLKYLDISKNKIIVIPYEIEKLSFLDTLNLSQNKIANLPKNFFTLESIKYIDLYSNTSLDIRIEDFTSFSNTIKYIDIRNTLTDAYESKKFENILNNTIIKYNKGCNCQ
jgi:Leucine-rich repeat (LRR) protein